MTSLHGLRNTTHHQTPRYAQRFTRISQSQDITQTRNLFHVLRCIIVHTPHVGVRGHTLASRNIHNAGIKLSCGALDRASTRVLKQASHCSRSNQIISKLRGSPNPMSFTGTTTSIPRPQPQLPLYLSCCLGPYQQTPQPYSHRASSCV